MIRKINNDIYKMYEEEVAKLNKANKKIDELKLEIYALKTDLVSTKNKKMVNVIKTVLILSTFIGSLILVLFKITISDMILLILLSVSLGMILYIALFELLKEIYNYKTKKETLYGIIIGIFLLLIMSLLD